jgi:phage tail sheath protein FI
MYGAAYHPYVLTSITYQYAEADVAIAGGDKDAPAVTLAAIKSGDKPETALYNAIRGALASERVTLPSSSAVAGVYAQVDRDRGVWKAPANVSLASVIGPVTKISNDEQENLNVDSTAGKSINAIRAFTGKGTLVWGARTLDGNSLDYRYIQVRRTLIYVEQSIKLALQQYVFASNDAQTWTTVAAAVSSFLTKLWQQGGLMGDKASDAFTVQCGLGSTMTGQDVLNGYMIVSVSLQMIHPAEFIVLTFSQQMQGT